MEIFIHILGNKKMNYYISDTHFGSEKHAQERNFENADKMNKTFVNNINERVTSRDTLYFLGDVAQMNYNAIPLLKKINCKNIILIRGNHDAGALVKNKSHIFKSVNMIIRIYDDTIKNKIILCHYPFSEWDGYYKGVLHFHGHTHGRNSSGTFVESLLPTSFPVSVDELGFYPRTAKEIISMKKTFEFENIEDLTLKVSPFKNKK